MGVVCRCFKFGDAFLKQAFELSVRGLAPGTGFVLFQLSNGFLQAGEHFAGTLRFHRARPPLSAFGTNGPYELTNCSDARFTHMDVPRAAEAAFPQRTGANARARRGEEEQW